MSVLLYIVAVLFWLAAAIALLGAFTQKAGELSGDAGATFEAVLFLFVSGLGSAALGSIIGHLKQIAASLRQQAAPSRFAAAPDVGVRDTSAPAAGRPSDPLPAEASSPRKWPE